MYGAAINKDTFDRVVELYRYIPLNGGIFNLMDGKETHTASVSRQEALDWIKKVRP